MNQDEIYDYFRLLYASIGEPFCPHCKKPLNENTEQMRGMKRREKRVCFSRRMGRFW